MSTIYRMSFSDAENQAIVTDIENPDGDAVITIQAAEDAVHIKTIDTDEDKFTPIRGKQCVLKFYNSQTVNFSTFGTGDDNSWKVTVYRNGLVIFVGWLDQTGIIEPFLYQRNEIVVLIATDGLGGLKDIRMVNRSGDSVANFWLESTRLIDYISYCLFRTGLQLDIKIINNLREQDHPSSGDAAGNFYHVVNQTPKTFEDGINKMLDCRTVLEHILGHDAFITQAKGAWWIVRVSELRQDLPMYVTTFDFEASFVGFGSIDPFEKAIGLKDISSTPFPASPDAIAYYSREKTVRLLDRPVKDIKLDFNYEYPLELLCNMNLTRDDGFISDLGDETDDDGNTLTVKSFYTACWQYLRNLPNDPQDSTEYTKVRYRDGHEVDRWLHFEPTANNDFYYLINNMYIPVKANDKIKFGLSYKYDSDLGGGSGHFVFSQAWLQLSADDGTFWNVYATTGSGSSNPTPTWEESDAAWATNQAFLAYEGDASSVDFTQWQVLSWDDIPPFPRSGQLKVLLLNIYNPSGQSKDIGSINLEYISFIGGNYNVFSGQSYTVTQDSGEYRRTIEEEVFMSNAPNLQIKGAMCYVTDAGYIRVGKFYEGQQFPADDPTADDLHEFGSIQAINFFNQHCFFDTIFRANCQGLAQESTDDDGQSGHPDIVHKYYVRDLEPDFNLTIYQLVNQDIDVRNDEWTGTLIENFNTDRGFSGWSVNAPVFNYETDV